jgi:hypothetical protein
VLAFEKFWTHKSARTLSDRWIACFQTELNTIISGEFNGNERTGAHYQKHSITFREIVNSESEDFELGRTTSN